MFSDELWRMAISHYSDVPVICRIRNQAPSYANKAAFPHLIAIAWDYESSNETGMPSEQTFEMMSLLEHLLRKVLEGNHRAFLSAVVTGKGVREWQWYSCDPEETMRLVNQVLSEYDPFPVQFYIDNDPGWVAYSRLGGAKGGAKGEAKGDIQDFI